MCEGTGEMVREESDEVGLRLFAVGGVTFAVLGTMFATSARRRARDRVRSGGSSGIRARLRLVGERSSRPMGAACAKVVRGGFCIESDLLLRTNRPCGGHQYDRREKWL